MTAPQPQDRDSGMPAPAQESTPRVPGYGHPEYHFVHSIMEMQKSLGEIRAEIHALRVTTDGIKAKVDDLMKWKHMILGGTVTIGFLVGVALTLVKLWPR
jgi:hypothetical protein